MKWPLLLPVIVALATSMSSAVVGQPPSEGASPSQSRYQRSPERLWELLFDETITSDEYAHQLDHFGIEIAAVSKNGKIESVTNVTEYKPEKHVSHNEREYRLRIGWQSGTLRAADRRLLRKAGISSKGKELTHFFPPAVQKSMERAELEYADRKVAEIRRTRFQIRPTEDDQGYEIVVVEQDPPKPKSDSANAPPPR
mgnify:CR=1 FL=1